MIIDEDEYLAHYGILRRSGRYPWGSGDNPAQRSKSFFDHVGALRKEGLSDTEIARGFGMTTTEFRNVASIAKNAKRASDISMAQRLKEKGMSNVAIGERMGINESSVRALLAPGQKDRVDVLNATTNMLKEQVDKKKYVDIGTGVEHHLPVPGLSNTKLNTAVAVLKDQGYTVHYVQVEQLGTGHKTTIKVLAPPDTPYSEVWRNRDQIKQVTEFTEDGGRSFLGVHDPLSISSKRVAINYAEDGGSKADGVIYVRPGVPDVSIGSSRYAQVRIAVDGTHYLKGMAMYKDDLPPGVDLVFNTNKNKTANKLDAMKPLGDDPDNPFGSIIRQRVERDSQGKARVTSVMNIVGSKEGSGQEGGWDTWSKNLSSQFLSKQTPHLAKAQLDLTHEKFKNQLEEIKALTNPAVRKKLLEDLADNVDSAAVHLKAAHLPRQASKVILPVNSLKETEIYAPTFRNGERVVLIRHPHGGTFEIPELTVNNRHPEARKLLGNAEDAVGINHKVAERLSGADFDGDTVIVIPNNNRQVQTSSPLHGLKDFDPKTEFPAYEGMKPMSPRTKQTQMGDVSNLITDMTIKGAPHAELARAVRHSMVVIDAEKHNLNWRESARVNNIPQLKEKYQGGKRAGAATLISRKKHEIDVPERKQTVTIDPATGKKQFRLTGATTINRKGEVVPKTEKAKKILEIDDVNKMSSGTPIEKVYADHSNRLKALANETRMESVRTKSVTYSPSAKTAYSNEVASLDSKLRLALRNRPLERQAQVLANTTYRAKRAANPDMDHAESKKIKAQALAEARTRTGAKKHAIVIEPNEWDAIQAGAVSNHKLTQILTHADMDQVKKYATPKTSLLMTATKVNRAKAMEAAGYTQAEIADQLGVSLTTLKSGLGGG